MSERFRRIQRENEHAEQQSPYNFCDRWCERCMVERQKRCSLYLDELDGNLTNIAEGREPDDPKGFAAKDERKLALLHNTFALPSGSGKDAEEYKKKQNARKAWIAGHELSGCAGRYGKETHAFLRAQYHSEKDVPPHLHLHIDTVAWYHILIYVKSKRALARIYDDLQEEDREEAGICDAVAQFAVCKKGVAASLEAFKNILAESPELVPAIMPLVSLLYSVEREIALIENSL